MQPPPLPTVGAEARSAFILLSTRAAVGWERPWGRGRERWEGLPGILAGVPLLLCSSGFNWAAGKVNFSDTLSCLPSPGLGVSSLAASQERVLCQFSHPLQRCCLPQVSKGTVLSPQGQGAGSQTRWSPAAGDIFWLEPKLCPHFYGHHALLATQGGQQRLILQELEGKVDQVALDLGELRPGQGRADHG